ncbi:MAG: bifunctional phosphoribosylaminoimidazolecarboxamide formyltransferase/IMP cyclohydrolase [Prevotellaceae bacterium]|jgi:phosphoribosylaminoimidazolecarboxamide formyltransferase/IMP cyclohydrolase|nr:bifunctional phosphoribosylaminoimidazolecarboxamide formyltransferase/IMP cyclohydrolase [Prevotellaceae bacterium]
MKALISVSNKEGVADFARELERLGWHIIATGGTMQFLINAGIKVINISDVTGFPEICDGRVKTLHPNVHGGLLARRDNENHLQALRENHIECIDLVCVNLYPFEQTIIKEGVSIDEAIENIDIGGPSMLRSAAKNCRDVTVVCDPTDYATVLAELNTHGNTTVETRFSLSAKAFSHTAEYDMCIAAYMRKEASLPEKLFLACDRVQTLRYGENPHQSATFFRQKQPVSYSLAFAKQLQGKELSYNNIQDANAALSMVREFDDPFCVAVKHMNPCGAAVGHNGIEAWQKAYNADTVSIFGGIVATNCIVDEAMAQLMKPVFLELVIAPDFTPEALNVFASKKNLRLITVNMNKSNEHPIHYVSVTGGILAQQLDMENVTLTPEMAVTKRLPSAGELNDMQFGMRIVKHVKSNAIVVIKNGVTVGIGAGQMNRIQSVTMALMQAHNSGETSQLTIASDAFFPFSDCVDLAATMGVTAIVQPGGSVRDADSVNSADAAGITMLFSGIRHFKH